MIADLRMFVGVIFDRSSYKLPYGFWSGFRGRYRYMLLGVLHVFQGLLLLVTFGHVSFWGDIRLAMFFRETKE